MGNATTECCCSEKKDAISYVSINTFSEDMYQRPAPFERNGAVTTDNPLNYGLDLNWISDKSDKEKCKATFECCCDENNEELPSVAIHTVPKHMYLAEEGGKSANVLPSYPSTSEMGLEEAAIAAQTTLLTVTLKKSSPNESWGFSVGRTDDSNVLTVHEPTGKALLDWAAANPEKRVRRGDEIIAVNGISKGTVCSDFIFQRMKAPQELMKALKNKTEIELTLRRQLIIVVNVMKISPLGLIFRANTLQVARVAVGSIDDFNATVTPNCQVMEGDMLLSINGKSVSGMDWKEELSNVADGEQLKLIFKRSET